jgi:hypothetical protein
MDFNCGTSQCIYYIMLTVIGVITATIVLDILLYFGYSYFTVRRYYSNDIAQWRQRELAKYGSGGGYIGKNWEEVYAPDEKMKMTYLTSNRDSIFGIESGEIYTCKKPCDGTSDDTFWTKVATPSKVKQIAASDTELWALSTDGSRMVKSAGSSKWTSKSGTAFTNISTNGTWGVKDSEPYKCIDLKDDCTKYSIPTVSVQQVASGKFTNWTVTTGGELYMSSSSSSSSNANANAKANTKANKWTLVKTPAKVKVKYVAIGLEDEVYIVTDEDLYTSDDGTVETPTWIKIPSAPKFISLAVNKDVYGIDINGKMWKG